MGLVLWGQQQDMKPSLPCESLGLCTHGAGAEAAPDEEGSLIGVGYPTCSAGNVVGPTPIGQSSPQLKAWPAYCSGPHAGHL